MRVIAWATVDLPLPDSPARPNTSPGLIDSETPSTARTGPRAVRYSTWRSRISSRVACSDSVAGPGARRATALAGMVHHRRRAAAHPAKGDALQNAGRLALSAQARVGELVDCVIDEGEGEGDERDAGPCRDECPPGAGEKTGIVRGPVEVGAPADRARVAEPEELQRRQRTDGKD